MPPAKQILGLAGWLLLCFAAAGIGGIGSRSAPFFYGSLAQPAWAPPATWFGPVWSVLYFLMAVAAWLVWRRGATPGKASTLRAFAVQLALNALWPWTFFAWRSGLASTACILLLWLAIGLTIKRFWSVQAAAGILMLPYLAWVTYAAALNVALWQGNRAAL